MDVSEESSVPVNDGSINVIEEFDYSTQSKLYSDHFKEWRKRKENPFSFSFEMNPKSLTSSPATAIATTECTV